MSHRIANADEIEITPEMERAGVSELVRFNPDYESEPAAVRRIFAAMCAASGVDRVCRS